MTVSLLRPTPHEEHIQTRARLPGPSSPWQTRHQRCLTWRKKTSRARGPSQREDSGQCLAPETGPPSAREFSPGPATSQLDSRQQVTQLLWALGSQSIKTSDPQSTRPTGRRRQGKDGARRVVLRVDTHCSCSPQGRHVPSTGPGRDRLRETSGMSGRVTARTEPAPRPAGDGRGAPLDPNGKATCARI